MPPQVQAVYHCGISFDLRLPTAEDLDVVKGLVPLSALGLVGLSSVVSDFLSRPFAFSYFCCCASRCAFIHVLCSELEVAREPVAFP